MAIDLYYSNSIEALADRFSEDIRHSGGPLEPARVSIPNPHTQKWLQIWTAKKNGITANIDFQLLDRLLFNVLQPLNEDASPIDLTSIAVMIFRAVRLQAKSNAAGPIGDYFLTDLSGRKSWQISIKLARLFLEYEHYREDMIDLWISGGLLDTKSPIEAAERDIYNAVFGKGGIRERSLPGMMTLPQLFRSVVPEIAAISGGDLFIFGDSMLSSFHMKTIYEIGKILTVRMYRLNPCNEFWEDVSTSAEDRAAMLRNIEIINDDKGEGLPEIENDNLLLKFWGRAGRESVRLLGLLEAASSGDLMFASHWLGPGILSPHNYKNPNNNDVLTFNYKCLDAVRDHILGRRNILLGKKQDHSLQILSVPDIYREVETIYNSILSNLRHDPSLTMTDIAVMVPDIEVYGPVIKSVFSREPGRISFSMIDSPASADSLLGRAIISLLDLASGNFTRKEVFDIIKNPLCQEALNITGVEAETWLTIADDLNIFHTFHNSGVVTGQYNTWEHGLKRLRIGRIMHDPGDITFSGYENILPYKDTGTSSDDIALFSGLMEGLYASLFPLKDKELDGQAWSTIVKGLTIEFIVIPDDYKGEATVLNQLTEDLAMLKHAGKLNLKEVREFISETLAGLSGTYGKYLSSGINISALVPGRQIPFRIIYIPGMEEGSFPGADDMSTLNLRNRKRRIGEISRAEADRYLFLEALISARDKVYISYISRDPVKDREYYPNSVLYQLISYLEQNITGEQFKIVTVPADGFSERYLSLETIGYSDSIVRNDSGTAEIVNFSDADRIIIAKTLSQDEILPMNTNKINRARERLTPVFSFNRDDNKKIEKIVKIDIGDLVHFLRNPAGSLARRFYGDYAFDFRAMDENENEPFFSTYPLNYLITAGSLASFFDSGKAMEEHLSQQYSRSEREGLLPGGPFREVDEDQYRKTLSERLIAKDKGLSLLELARSNRDLTLYKNILMGERYIDSVPDKWFGPIVFDLSSGEKTVTVEVTGSLQYFWKVNDRAVSTVLAGSSNFRFDQALQPLLFYFAARSGINPDLETFCGADTFILHVSYKKGDTSLEYSISRDEAFNYVHSIISDYINSETFDLIPIEIITDKNITGPGDMRDDASETEKARYRGMIIDKINEVADKKNPSFRMPDILTVIKPEVPTDVYDKVLRRFGPLFIQGEGS